MSREFKIDKDFYIEGEIIFNKDEFIIEPGLTVLVGCNGSGKTSLLNGIKETLENENIEFIYFDNRTQGDDRAVSHAGFIGDFDFLASAVMSSEGENIMLNLGKTVEKIGKKLRNNLSEFWILMDAVDSGFSIDGILDLKNVFNLILNDNRNTDIYIVAAANCYELANNESCFDVTNCEYISFKDYDEYKQFIINSRKLKDIRYKKTKE